MRDLSGLVIVLDPKAFKARKISGFLPAPLLEELAKDARLLDHVQVEVDLRLEKERWRATGVVKGKVELACSRCLDPFPMAIEAEVDQEFVVEPDVSRRMAELEVIEDLVYLEDGNFSILRLVEEEMIVALPMIPLCRDDCAGLCQGCGAELNREPCRCTNVEHSSPFAVLKGRLS